MQGRVFAARRVIAQFSYLIGFTLVGPLAGYLFPVVRDVEDDLPDHDAADPKGVRTRFA